MERALIIDGNNYYNIAYYAAQKNGGSEYIAIGFFQRLYEAFQVKKDEHVFLFIVWDSSINSRKIKFPYYKAQRKPKPDGFYDMMPYIKDTLTMRGVQQYVKEGYEGDDIIGQIVTMCKDKKYAVTIASSDHDMYSLLDKNIIVYDPLQKKIVSYDDFKMDMGIEPFQWKYVKSLMGDNSDNIDGVKGIGEKGALKLIQDFGDLDKLYSSDMSVLSKSIVSKLTKVEDDYNAKMAAYEALELVSFKPVDLEYPKNAIIDEYKVNSSIHIGA